MPYANGTYHLPERTTGDMPDPLSTAHARLRIYLWNVLAFYHDDDEHSAARWGVGLPTRRQGADRRPGARMSG